jgi:hypothetical protein
MIAAYSLPYPNISADGTIDMWLSTVPDILNMSKDFGNIGGDFLLFTVCRVDCLCFNNRLNFSLLPANWQICQAFYCFTFGLNMTFTQMYWKIPNKAMNMQELHNNWSIVNMTKYR